jgi:hypothetical protein
MAINKIDAPLATSPATFATPVINQLLALAINTEKIERISGGYVRKGSMFNIGGAMYVCDGDTAITGSNTLAIAVKLTPSGSTASASYISDITGVSWNGDYHGYYDVSGNLYILLVSPGYCILFGTKDEIIITSTETRTAHFKMSKVGTIKIYTHVIGTYNPLNLSMLVGHVKIKKNNIVIKEYDFPTTLISDATNIFVDIGDIIDIFAQLIDTERFFKILEQYILYDGYGMLII